MWITNASPNVPAADDYRSESTVVLVQTRAGALYAARWVIYADAEVESCWELEGREGLQLEAADVVAWQSITPYLEA